MSAYRFGVKIEVNATTTPTDSTIGLESGVFYWYIGDGYPVTSRYTNGQGILARDGIGQISKSVKVDRFGDIANIDSTNLAINNTAKFWTKFISAFGDNASLHGARVTIYEYDESNVETSIYSGVCDLPSFDKSTYKIPVRSLQDARDSKLGFEITEGYKTFSDTNIPLVDYTDPEAIGDILPVTFGENEKTQFKRTGQKEEVISITNSTGVQSVFPAYSATTTAIGVRVGKDATDTPTDLDKLYEYASRGNLKLKVIEGDNSGTFLSITSIAGLGFVTNGGDTFYAVAVFYDSASQGIPDPDNKIQFINTEIEYNADFWQSGGFYNSQDVQIQANADIFSYDEGYNRLNNFVIDIDQTATNQLKAIFPRFINDINSTKGFEFKLAPLEYNFQDANDYNQNIVFAPTNNYNAKLKAFHSDSIDDSKVSNVTILDGDTTREDGSAPNEWSFTTSSGWFTGSAPYFIRKYLLLNPPTPPENFDNAYLLINSTFTKSVATGLQYLEVFKKNWWGGSEEIYSSGSNGSVSINMTNTPLNFSQNGVKNIVFWDNETKTFGANNYLRGYDLIPLASSKNEYNSVSQFAIALLLNPLSQDYDFDWQNNIAGVIFDGVGELEDSIYTNFKGREYKETILSATGWTSNELINDPIGAMAHAKALQNFDAEGETPPSTGWGLDYPSTFLPYLNLAQNTNGSFYHNDFINFGWYDATISRQITDSKESYSKAITKDLCNKFFLVNWTNNDGKECVAQVAQKSALAVSINITQTDMISWGDRREQDTRNIFCEPIVRFGFDAGSGKFTKSVAITNVSSNLSTTTDKANAVKGLDNKSENIRADLWDRARALYLYYGVVNDPPKVLSENKWIGNRETAFWYLKKWLRFQGAGIVGGVAKVIPKNYFSFVVPYELGRTWDIGTRLNVKIPNITDDVYYEAMITSLAKETTRVMPRISVKVILFDLDTAEEQDIQDSFDNTLDTWQDTTNTGADNIQDEV